MGPNKEICRQSFKNKWPVCKLNNQKKKQSVKAWCCETASYLLLSQLDLVELLHVLLIVLLLELTDEADLLLGVVGVLLSSILLELHCRLGIQCCHYLLSS